jgi:hypothetical protein
VPEQAPVSGLEEAPERAAEALEPAAEALEPAPEGELEPALAAEWAAPVPAQEMGSGRALVWVRGLDQGTELVPERVW